MALHKDLPIYKVTYDLTRHAASVTSNMPRDFKAGLGGRLRDECFELVVLVYRANAADDKVPYITKLLERLQVVELIFRLSVDLRTISKPAYAAGIKLTDQIGKQATGWRNYAATSPAASRSRS